MNCKILLLHTKKASKGHRIPPVAFILAPSINPHAWHYPARLKIKGV
jgi:hypothetical protein